jgi:hypothetical protein
VVRRCAGGSSPPASLASRCAACSNASFVSFADRRLLRETYEPELLTAESVFASPGANETVVEVRLWGAAGRANAGNLLLRRLAVMSQKV